MTFRQWSKTRLFRLRSAAISAASALGLLAVVSAQGVPSPAAPQPPRTGLIVGQVVETGSGSPVSEAIVTLVIPRQGTPDLRLPPELRPQPINPRVKADAEGRFFFTNLAAGDYSLTVMKEGYVSGGYGTRRPGGPQQRVRLAEGERRADITIELTKYAVISGTVVDEAGEPVVGVAVRALDRQPGATVTFGINNINPVTTDDRGVFRIPQLVPASYVVVVPSTLTTAPVSVLNSYSQDAAMRQQLASATAEVAPLGRPRTLQVGDSALMTLNRGVIPPPPADASNRLEIYRTTYYPSATTASAATSVPLRSGEERDGVNIVIRPVPSFTVTGRLVLPDGRPPAPTAIRLNGEASADLILPDREFDVATGVSGPDGRFTLLGIPPGKYGLKTYVRRSGATDNPLLWSNETLTVSTADVGDVVVHVRPGLSVEGRLVLRGANGASVPISDFRLPAITFYSADRSIAGIEAQVTPDGAFAGYGGGAPYSPDVRGGFGWYLSSCVINGKDVAETSFVLDADVKDVVITLTNQLTPLSGTVTGVRETKASDATVAIFPVNPQKWNVGNSDWRNMLTTRVSPGGTYAIDRVPPGEYFVVAIDDRDAVGWTDPAVLEALSRVASRVTMTDGVKKTLDLTVKGIK